MTWINVDEDGFQLKFLRIFRCRIWQKNFSTSWATTNRRCIVWLVSLLDVFLFVCKRCRIFWCDVMLYWTARQLCDAVVWGTALQAGKSRVQFPVGSFVFFMDLLIPATLWHYGSRNISGVGWRGPVGGANNLTTFVYRLFRNSGSLYVLEPYEPEQPCNGVPVTLSLLTH